MRTELEKFLTAEDLDDLLLARKTFGEPDAADADAVTSILVQWHDSQAISNLLFYPKIIPFSVRAKYVLKGLHENDMIYYVLATIVGLQSLTCETFSDSDISQIRDRLIDLMMSDQGIIAARASVAISGYLHRDEASCIVVLLNHPNNSIKHNVLVALIKLVGLTRIRTLIDSAAQTDLISDQAAAFCRSRFAQVLELSETEGNGVTFDISSLSSPILSHIPNLKDIISE